MQQCDSVVCFKRFYVVKPLIMDYDHGTNCKIPWSQRHFLLWTLTLWRTRKNQYDGGLYVIDLLLYMISDIILQSLLKLSCVPLMFHVLSFVWNRLRRHFGQDSLTKEVAAGSDKWRDDWRSSKKILAFWYLAARKQNHLINP